MPLICLDTNALNRVATDDSERLSSVRTSLSYAGSSHVLVLGAVLDELAPMLADPRAANADDAVNRMVNFLLGGVKVRGLRSPLERRQAEVDAAVLGKPRPLWTCLYSVSETRAVIARYRRDKTTIEETLQFLNESRPAIGEERRTRLSILNEAPPEFDLSQVDLHALTDSDVRKRLEQGGYALPVDRSSWPASEQLPSFWYQASFLWAYRYVNLHQPKLIENDNDVQDLRIYTESAYADFLVTDDRRLRRYAECCPGPKARLMRFDEWMSTI